ncbi:MAG: methyltransferase [Alphaproteobacteria bacterium]|nr:methyltransferase [Alphaproteobacteria bacterium]
MPTPLHAERLEAVHNALRALGARRVADLGCGDGDFLIRLAADPDIDHITGVEISRARLDALAARLAEGGPQAQARVTLRHDSLIEAGRWIGEADCVVMVEVIEHLSPAELVRLERRILHEARPPALILTTPNAEYNGRLGVPAHRFRHPEHRFEWTRSEFRGWARRVAGRAGYGAGFQDMGGVDPEIGGASQMAILIRYEAPGSAP